MPTYFKASKAVNGFLTSINTNLEDQSIWFRLTKQTGWDDNKKLGSFKGGESFSIKFNLAEVGGFINAVERRDEPFSFYHTTVSGRFQFYDLEPREQGKPRIRGFSLSLKKGEEQIKTSFTLAEAIDLVGYLDHARRNIYSVIDAQEAQRLIDSRKRSEQRNTRSNGSAPKAGNLDVPGWEELAGRETVEEPAL